MQNNKVYDYVNNLISLAENPEDFEKCKFAILCDRYPIQTSSKNYLGKVLYISIKSDKGVWRLYPDLIKTFDIEYIQLSTNSRRKLHGKMNEFFVNGDNTLQEYKESLFYNYSIELADINTKKLVQTLRAKYKLETPQIYVGEHQDLVIE